MTSVPVALHEGLDHLSKHPSLPGVFGGRSVEGFELVAYPALAFRDHSQESTTPKVRAGSDCQQTEGTENKSDDAPRGLVVTLASCSGRCEEGTSGSSYKPEEKEQAHFASISTHLF